MTAKRRPVLVEPSTTKHDPIVEALAELVRDREAYEQRQRDLRRNRRGNMTLVRGGDPE